MKTVYVNVKNDLNERKIKKVVRKLHRISKKEDIAVALDKSLEKNEELHSQIKDFGIKILDGKWLFKFLICDIIEYISKSEHKKQEIQNIAILMNSQDDIMMGQIFDIAKKVKNLRIITKDVNKFNFLEAKLYEEYGIALQVTNNKKKSLANVDIIINFDYDEEMIKECCIAKQAILININEKIKHFNGTSINNYEIQYNKDNFPAIGNEREFDDNVIYESYIYRKDTLQNIRSQLKKDNVKLVKLA